MSFSPWKTATPLELDPAYGEKFAQDYNRKVGKLAWDVAQLLKKLETGHGASDKGRDAQATAKPTIYLAECSYDRKEAREILEGDLRRHGYTVLPDQQLPREEADYVAAVERLLSAARFPSIWWARAMAPCPMVPAKNRWWCCKTSSRCKRSKSGALPRVIWLPEGTHSEQAQQQAFIEALHQDAEAQFGADLITGDIEALQSRDPRHAEEAGKA